MSEQPAQELSDFIHDAVKEIAYIPDDRKEYWQDWVIDHIQAYSNTNKLNTDAFLIQYSMELQAQKDLERYG